MTTIIPTRLSANLPWIQVRQPKYAECKEDVDKVIDSQGEHQLVEVPLDLLPAEPEDGQAVANQPNQSNKHLGVNAVLRKYMGASFYEKVIVSAFTLRSTEL